MGSTNSLFIRAGMVLCLLLLGLTVSYGAAPGKIRVLLFTGGHDFEQDAFYQLFQGHDDIEYTEVIQPRANDAFTNGAVQRYDVLVFYDMWQPISESQKQGLMQFLKDGGGLVGLHHCLASYQDWPEFLNILGGKYLLENGTIDGKAYGASKYKHDEEMNISVVDKNHFITQGIEDFQIHDETYGDFYTKPDAHVLLKTDHPNSSLNLAWTQNYGKGRSVYIQLGHDHLAYENPNYRRLVTQAIRWAAQRPNPISLFNNNDLTGWEAEGNAVWTVEDGILIGKQNENEEPGDLLTKESYRDFILTVEFKVQWPANTGVWFRYQNADKAYQADILEWKNPVCWTGTLYCPGKMFLSMNENEKLVKKDDWNTFVIHCQGDHLITYLNGTKVSDVFDKSSDQGKVGFQVHAGSEFKDMAVLIRKVVLIPEAED